MSECKCKKCGKTIECKEGDKQPECCGQPMSCSAKKEEHKSCGCCG